MIGVAGYLIYLGRQLPPGAYSAVERSKPDDHTADDRHSRDSRDGGRGTGRAGRPWCGRRPSTTSTCTSVTRTPRSPSTQTCWGCAWRTSTATRQAGHLRHPGGRPPERVPHAPAGLPDSGLSPAARGLNHICIEVQPAGAAGAPGGPPPARGDPPQRDRAPGRASGGPRRRSTSRTWTGTGSRSSQSSLTALTSPADLPPDRPRAPCPPPGGTPLPVPTGTVRSLNPGGSGERSGRVVREPVGLPKEALDTPALVVDLDALDRNVARMAATFRGESRLAPPHQGDQGAGPWRTACCAPGPSA